MRLASWRLGSRRWRAALFALLCVPFLALQASADEPMLGGEEMAILVSDDQSKCPSSVVRVPFADGLAPVRIGDHNDHAAIEVGLCASLHTGYVSCETNFPDEYYCD